MLDPLGLQLLAHLRRDELVREATAEGLAQEALRTDVPRATSPWARWRLVVASIIERFRVAARLESVRG